MSKWERGDTLPDITLLPSLANLYETSIDVLMGMDKINAAHSKGAIYNRVYAHIKNGEDSNAIEILSEALKTFPTDAGLMSYLAMALALDGDPAGLKMALSLCERASSANASAKTNHTNNAARCFIHLKAGEKENAVACAKNLPHMRESREAILAEIEKTPAIADIDSYLRFIALGERDGAV